MDDYDFSVDDLPGSYSGEDIRTWVENVETVLEHGSSGGDPELEHVYEEVSRHYSNHEDLAEDELFAEAFYELEAAADLVDAWDYIDMGLEKESSQYSF